MSHIRSAQITSFYLFDVAEAINLAAIPGLIGGEAVPARLSARPARPAYVQYQPPPVSFDGEQVDMAELGGFRVRVRVYDYGVVSLALNRPFEGSWPDADRPGSERDGERIARARGQAGLPSSHRSPAIGHEGPTRFLAVRGLRRLCDSRARYPVDVRGAHRRPLRGDCAAASRRATGPEPPGKRRGAPPPHLVPRQRSRGAFVERGPRLRHRGRRAGGVRDSGVRQLAAPGVSLLRRPARQGAHRHLRASSSRGAGTSSSAGAIPAPHVACTRCSSMSTS